MGRSAIVPAECAELHLSWSGSGCQNESVAGATTPSPAGVSAARAEVRVGKRVRTPVQARSRQSVESIIEAAAHVLADRGLPGFNTKVVAAAAGVNVATLYQYFENKQAILRELARRSDRERTRYLRGEIEQFAHAADWEPLVRRTVAGLVELRRCAPAAGALRRALAASPDLQELHRHTLDVDAVAIRDVLLARRPDLGRERARAIGVLFAVVTDSTVDMAVGDDGVDQDVIDELSTMLIAHLRPLFGRSQ